MRSPSERPDPTRPPSRIAPRALIWLALAACLPACAKHEAMAPSEDYEEGMVGGVYGGVVGGALGGEVASDMPMPMSAPAAPAPARARADMARKSASGSKSYTSPPPPPPPYGNGQVREETAAHEQAEARMVHYDGYARLRVGKLEIASDTLVKIATEAGGRVESLSRARLILRVPVAQFRDIFAKMLGTGDVLDKSITAQDVTEAFQSIELRLGSAKAARERLQALLARSKDENEKLMLIRELQRLGEEIDQLESQARLVADLASMSRITIDLVPREALVSTGPVAESSAFGWIRRLSPFRDDVLSRGKRPDLPVPVGMVSLDVKKRFVAESADGARVRAARLVNAPRGSAAFWLDALEQRLAPEFARAETSEVGAWKILRLVDRSDKPYVYVLAVRTDGEKLDLVEVYYPSAAQEERHAPAVRAVLSGGGAA